MTKFAKLKFSELKTKKISDFETSFVLQPLERGFANTLGNAIRRILLSSVSGVAPFAVRIENVEHEFQTMPNVTEDVVQFILNLKEIKFIFNEELFKENEVVKVVLKDKKGEIKASDLTLPVGVQVVNPDTYIATLAKPNALVFELFITTGRGFISFEENKKVVKELMPKIESKLKTGAFIAVDSDFSPVDNVSYKSVELNSSAAIIEEQLTLNVKTNGVIEAKAAIAQAANILIQHSKLFLKLVDNTEDVFEDGKKPVEVTPSKSINISMLDLSVRSYNCLKRAGFNTLEDLSNLTVEEVSSIKNLGKKSIEEIINKLKEHGIILEGVA